MARSKHDYETLLKRMVEQRTGKDFDIFLTPQVDSAAACWEMLDHIHEELAKAQLTSIELGSSGQQKLVANPLLTYYNNLHRTLILHLTALGLNYASNPERIKEDAGSERKTDKMEDFFSKLR